MPSSQDSNNNLEQDSNNKDATNDFINNYIKDINSYLGDFLKTSQPSYDPNDTSIKDSLSKSSETTSSVNTQEIKQETTKSSSISLSELLKSPTINPEIFSNRPFKDYNTNDKSSSVNDEIPFPQKEKQSLAQQLKISELRTDYFDQKKEIWNGALINCSELHIKLQECMSFGGFVDRISLCSNARRKFWSCMEDQKKFLTDNGYASPNKSVAENDEILHKADLFNISKLAQEKQAEN
ncbi:hypothetical protein C1645_734671 [Glomus cerebriforme]|uniref:Uncharacterized protein n=1 Tax=Glomus cerebriforme TaxID=658196 RepID=A0A397TDQ9_9GLOM|nr:hypothetical protein C1645_734671 [Glomus cerebriforme]